MCCRVVALLRTNLSCGRFRTPWAPYWELVAWYFTVLFLCGSCDYPQGFPRHVCEVQAQTKIAPLFNNLYCFAAFVLPCASQTYDRHWFIPVDISAQPVLKLSILPADFEVKGWLALHAFKLSLNRILPNKGRHGISSLSKSVTDTCMLQAAVAQAV